MKLAADRQAECERMVREAAEAAAAAKAAALVAGPGGKGDDAPAAGGEAGEGAGGPKKRKPKSAGAPKSRTELPTSGYHGVVKKSPNCFQCKTLVNGKVLFIGSFNTAESAARAYDVCMRDLTQRSGDKREPSYNFESDAVAEKAAELAEAAVQQGGGSKKCGQCGEVMPVRLKVCRKCRQGSGTRSAFKGVRAKSGTAAVPPIAAPAAAAGDEEGAGADGEAPAPAAPVAAAKYQAFVWHDRTNEYIGTFHTEEEAALAYDIRYREVFGDGADPAKLNWASIAEGQAAVDAALRVRLVLLACWCCELDVSRFLTLSLRLTENGCAAAGDCAEAAQEQGRGRRGGRCAQAQEAAPIEGCSWRRRGRRRCARFRRRRHVRGRKRCCHCRCDSCAGAALRRAGGAAAAAAAANRGAAAAAAGEHLRSARYLSERVQCSAF